MSNPVIIVPCGAAKLTHAAPARELYTGPYHRACLGWALSVAPSERCVILSARYGFVKLDQVIAPYDLRMGRPGSATVSLLRGQATLLHILDGPVIALGGAAYIQRCKAIWPWVACPLGRYGGMFRQIEKLNHNLGCMPDQWT